MENLVEQLKSTYVNKRLLVTGHNGFKGSWLVGILNYLGSEVHGLSLSISNDSPFKLFHSSAIHQSYELDIRNFNNIQNFISSLQPDLIFHLAAQSIVLDSYIKPRETFEVNVLGTANILQSVLESSCRGVIVTTTDKVYKNDNSGTLFKETDELWGHDPYSLSKVGAELTVAAWQNLPKSSSRSFVTARAGNVFGPGDRASRRLIPDIVRGIRNRESVTLRNPDSIRPWQFVLDPLMGYVMLGKRILDNKIIEKSYNFGPKKESFLTVRELSAIFSNYREVDFRFLKNTDNLESKVLKLDSKLATESLGWKFDTSIRKGIELLLNFENDVIEPGEMERLIQAYLFSHE